MIGRINNNPKLLQLFFYVVIIEIVVGGSGRMIEFGALSFKMVLYAIAMVISFLSIKRDKVKLLVLLQMYFLIVVAFGILVGSFNGASTANIFEDVKPLLFILMVNYFTQNICNLDDVKRLGNIIKISSLIMAIIYLVVVAFLFLGIMNFEIFYAQQSEGSEVMFRNENLFFYKGFLYLGVGFFFCILSGKKIDQLFGIIIFAALCLTLTRGFIFMASGIYIFYIFFINKKRLPKIVVGAIGIALLIYLLPILYDTLGDKSDSDSIRVDTFHQVVEMISPFSVVFGNGFGNGVAIRPVHMEISYLEIFHKQGLLGLSFWFLLLFIIVRYYYLLKDKDLKYIALPFILSVFFTYLQSLTNPYINNPIGISIIVLSLVVLYKLNTFDAQEDETERI